MSEQWLRMLRQQVDRRGASAVARELGISPSTVSLVVSGKYPASTAKIEQRITNLYGDRGMVACPVLGEIEPGQCVTFWERARKIGVRCGNPATIRLYKSCCKCQLRS